MVILMNCIIAHRKSEWCRLREVVKTCQIATAYMTYFIRVDEESQSQHILRTALEIFHFIFHEFLWRTTASLADAQPIRKIEPIENLLTPWSLSPLLTHAKESVSRPITDPGFDEVVVVIAYSTLRASSAACFGGRWRNYSSTILHAWEGG